MAVGNEEILIAGKGASLDDLKRRAEATKVTSGGKEDLLSVQREALEIQRRSLGFQELEIQLLKRGYHGFIQAEKVRARVNPEQFDQLMPPWFEELDDDDRGMIRTRMHMSYLAAIKRDTGMVSLDTWSEVQGLRIDRRDFANMWKKMPGFRVAMATMVYDIFKPGEDHLIISGESGRNATEGYAIVGDPARFEEYKKGLIEKVEAYLKPQKDELEGKYKVSLNELAIAAVSSVDNFLFAGGAYDSGDLKRAIVPGSANIYSEQVRAFFQPGVKGKIKWLQDKGKGVTGESFGGPLGDWIRGNAAARRGDIRQKVENLEMDLIPKRLFYSMQDHTPFNEVKGYVWSEKTLAQALINEGKVRLTDSLWDYQLLGRGIDLDLLLPDELLGYYADLRSSGIKLYKHITSDDPKDRLERGKLMTELAKARKDDLLNPIYRNPEVVEAAIIMLVSPEQGLVRGIPEKLLQIDASNYDSLVNHALSDPRLFEGMPRNFRRWLLADLHAVDLHDLGRQVISFIPLIGELTSPDAATGVRNSLRRRAAKNIREEIQGKS